jgi:hypothetical protein
LNDLILFIFLIRCQTSYEFYATQPELYVFFTVYKIFEEFFFSDSVSLETPLLGDQLKQSIGKLHLVHTNPHEILISASVGIFFSEKVKCFKKKKTGFRIDRIL